MATGHICDMHDAGMLMIKIVSVVYEKEHADALGMNAILKICYRKECR